MTFTVTAKVEDVSMKPEEMLWNHKPPPPHKAAPAEVLFEFVRTSDRAFMACELRFMGESYGWEARFLERGELLFSRGGFALRAQAIQWATVERDVMAGR